MKKNEEKKLIKLLKESLGDNYKETDMILIQDLIDWVSIKERAIEDLKESVADGGSMSWQALTTISMCSKAINSSLKTLGITPNDRLKQKLLAQSKDENGIDNLNSFLNG